MGMIYLRFAKESFWKGRNWQLGKDWFGKQRPRCCSVPGVLGGLILASWLWEIAKILFHAKCPLLGGEGDGIYI